MSSRGAVERPADAGQQAVERRVAVSEAQALSGELIDLKKVRFDRLKRPSVASFEQSPRDREDRSSGRSGIDATALEPGSTMQGLDVDGADLPAPLENLQWPVASLNLSLIHI